MKVFSTLLLIIFILYFFHLLRQIYTISKTPSSPLSCSLSHSTDAHPSSCSISSSASPTGLAPVMDPRFNLKEAAKQMLLLEDHLFHSEKRCKDCCIKHLMTIEAFLDEAITLDKEGKYHDLIISLHDRFMVLSHKAMSKIHSGDMSDKDCCDIAQDLRQIRKPCMIEGSKLG